MSDERVTATDRSQHVAGPHEPTPLDPPSATGLERFDGKDQILTGSGSTTLLPRPRVLIVDDDAGIRALCAAHLERQGYDVIEARDGQEGLDLAFAEAPDLVLLDISMPVLDGFGLAAALRDDERTAKVPLVFLSGEADPRVQTLAYEAGASGYFAKPFDPAAVGAFVQHTLAQLSPEPQLGGHAF